MNAIRTWDVWSSPILACYQPHKNRAERIAVFQAMCLGIGLILFFVFGIVSDTLFLSTGWSVVFRATMAIALTQPLPLLSRIHVAYGVHHAIVEDAVKYYKLTPEERSEYSREIESIIRDPDLTREQAYELSREMSYTHAAIMHRRRARDKMLQRQVDITSVVSELKRSRELIHQDAETYRNA